MRNMMYNYKDIKQVHLEPTQKCQARCPMCDRNENGGVDNKYLTNADLSLMDIKMIMPKEFVRQLNNLYMCGNHGDPMMATDTLEIMQWLREVNPNIHLSMITNGGARPISWWADLAKVVDKVDLTKEEMVSVMTLIMEGKAEDSLFGAFLTALRMKGESTTEIVGAAIVMRDKAERIKVKADLVVDTCGTGGDGANTFNISTAAAFVVAGCGVTVAKHGNRAVSSRSGSADVLKCLGVNIEAGKATVEKCLDSLL